MGELLEESFNKGFEETLRYKKQHGNANAPHSYKTPEGFNLGSWQSTQRENFRNGTLEQDRIKKLEEIGFVWECLKNHLIRDLRKHFDIKSNMVTANAPRRYKTPEGFNLGTWQSHQRKYFKNGKLEQDRIKKLEEIGFVWDAVRGIL